MIYGCINKRGPTLPAEDILLIVLLEWNENGYITNPIKKVNRKKDEIYANAPDYLFQEWLIFHKNDHVDRPAGI